MIDYLIAISWGFIGWAARVALTFYWHSKEVECNKRGKFVWNKFRQKYDQDWILGFFSMLMFAAIADLIWEYGLSTMLLGNKSPYDTRINVLIGFMSIYLVEKLAKKSN